MSKTTSLVVAISLLLLITLTHAARHEPVFHQENLVKDLEANDVDEEENCNGIGEAECLMRRSLVAHTDYIYTNKVDKP